MQERPCACKASLLASGLAISAGRVALCLQDINGWLATWDVDSQEVIGCRS